VPDFQFSSVEYSFYSVICLSLQERIREAMFKGEDQGLRHPESSDDRANQLHMGCKSVENQLK